MFNNPLGERQRNERLVYHQKCTICQVSGVYTEFHHIITPNQAPQHRSNANNMVELCLKCHNSTTATISFRKLNRLPEDDRCCRCGRSGHSEAKCYARIDVRGHPLLQQSSPPQGTIQNATRRYNSRYYVEEDSEDSDDSNDSEDNDSSGDSDSDSDIGACYRCGRQGHWAPNCYARTDVNGRRLM